MEKFEKDKLITLFEAVEQTDYYESLGWEADELSGICASLKAGDDDEWEDDDIIDNVECFAFEDNTAPLPKEVMDLVDYVYGLAIEQKDAERINDYGTLFYTGRAGVQDFDKAAYYYQMSSDLGCSWSVENLGYIHYYGRTGQVDYQKAYDQFAKGSAVFSRACSTYKLGDMYRNGYYVAKDEKSAYLCYKRAESLIDNGQRENIASNVAPDIYFRLAECNLKGMGTDVDLDAALRYYQKAEQGFIVKLRQGDYFIRKMLRASIDGQNEVRQLIFADLPNMDWAKDNTGNKTI